MKKIEPLTIKPISRKIKNLILNRSRNTHAKNVGFSLYYEPRRGELIQLTSEVVCREVFIDRIANIYNNPSNPYYVDVSKEFDVKKTRVLFSYPLATEAYLVKEEDRKWATKSAKRAAKVIRFFEKSIGTKTKTQVREVKPSKGQITNKAGSGCSYFVTKSPNVWQSSPHMISIYLLLIRIGRYKGIEKFSTYTGFKNRLLSMRETEDTESALEIYPFLYTIMKNQKTLFKDCPSRYFEEKFLDSGIEDLCLGFPKDEKLKTRLKKLMKKYSRINRRTLKK